MSTTRLTGWRKIANALWDAPSDPQIYGALEIDATPVLELIERARTQGHRVTATHLVGRAVARALVAVPDLNVRLVGDLAISRESVDVFFIAAVAKGRDLTGVKITDVARKNVLDISKELSERSARMKAGDDPDFARVKRTMEALPRPLLRVALRVTAWMTGDHAKSIPSLGVMASPFGSAMVSSVGMLGLPMGFSPIAWMYRVPLLVLVGEICEKPVAISGRVEIRPILPITATVDHRYVDGAQLAEALRAFREYLANPASFEPIADGTKVIPFRRWADRGEELHEATERLVEDAGKELDALRGVRDDLRLQLHLASTEAKAQWQRLEDRWRALESHDARALIAEIRDGYRRLHAAIPASGSGSAPR